MDPTKNPQIELQYLEHILLGWDAQGDHNVNEVKSVMDAHQELLNEIIASQPKFQAIVKGMTRNFKVAINKILSLTNEAVIPKTILVPHTHAHPDLSLTIPCTKTLVY